MQFEDRLSSAGRLYVWSVILCGVFVVVHSVSRLWLSPVNLQWFVLAGLTLLSGSFTVRIPGVHARLSVSETFVFAAVLLYGPAAATVIVVLDTLIISLWFRASFRQPARVLFNMAAPSVAIWIASHVFYSIAGIEPLSTKSQPHILRLVLPLFALAACYFVLNSFLIAGAVAFEKRVRALTVWRSNFLWLSLNYFSGASVAALLLPYLQSAESQFIRIIGIILPLLLISYLTFKTALGRVEDANSHLTELNRLYLSTIETLAMAIDAKDQITHGHIRRVQQHAVKLASAMGTKESSQIRAIEAAALLHDMGKLAVPEHILNKPGPLTPAEFEKMKLHASVGADILSAIDFPYPVVPIVRHHHENWDGTGYPAGLSGTDIPIGARILSVVDCFDALTSDRPYRPRLSDRDALRILQERRGKMYDPLVVDTFIEIYPQLREATFTEAANSSLKTINASSKSDDALTERRRPLERIAASRSETLALLGLAQALTTATTPDEVAEPVLSQVRSIIPSAVASMFVVDQARQELVAVRAIGDNSGLISGLRIGLGKRLSGWVAANRRGIRNSDAMLDLGDAAREISPALRTCMATPIVSDEECLGVITLYSTTSEGFTEDHERVVEAIAKQAADALATAVRRTADPPKEQRQNRNSANATAGFVYLRLTESVGSDRAGDLAEIENHARRITRPDDTVLRPSPAEILIIIRGMDPTAATAAAARLQGRLEEFAQAFPFEPGLLYARSSHAPDESAHDETLIRLARVRYAADTDATNNSHSNRSIH